MVNRRSKRLSFAELVAKAEQQGLLKWPLPGAGDDPIDAPALLIELKDYRKEARHRASQAFESWLNQNWERVVLVIERLVSQAEGIHARARS